MVGDGSANRALGFGHFGFDGPPTCAADEVVVAASLRVAGVIAADTVRAPQGVR